MKRRILLLDIDGTLIDYAGKMPSSAVEAVRRAVQAGHRAYACTGRTPTGVRKDMWGLGLSGMIGGDGTFIQDGGQVLQQLAIPEEEERRLVDWLRGRGLGFYLQCVDGLYTGERFEEAMERIRGEFLPEGESGSMMMAEFTKGDSPYRNDVLKAAYIQESDEDLVAMREAFPDLAVSQWGGASARPLMTGLTVSGTSKAEGVRFLLRHLGASKEDAVCFGDDQIDVDMFHACGTSVAMGNALPEVKRAATLVTDAVDQDGLLHAFEKLGLLDPAQD